MPTSSAYFKPKTPRFGMMLVLNDLKLPASPVTASSTITYQWPPYLTPRRILNLAAGCITVAAGAGAITATVKKWDSTASAYVPLTAAFSLTALVSKVGAAIPLLATLTDAQLTLNPGDTLAVDVIAASTVTTQPTELGFTAEVATLS